MFMNKVQQAQHFAWGLITPDKDFDWQSAVKSRRALSRLLFRVFFLVVGLISPMWSTCIHTISKKIRVLYKNQGLPGLVKYLKVLYIVTQQAAGGQRVIDLQSIGPRVARNLKGVPRIINKAHRRLISDGDPAVLRMYLTIFGLYRVLDIPGKVKLHTITAPPTYKVGTLMEYLKFVPLFFALLVKKITHKKSLGGPLGLTEVQRGLGYVNEKGEHPTLRIDRLLPITTSGPLSGPVSCLEDPLWLKITDKIRARKEFWATEDPNGIFSIGTWRTLRPPELLIRDDVNDRFRGKGKYSKQDALKSSSIGTIWFSVSAWMNHVCMPDLINWCKLFDIKPVKTLFRTAHEVEFGKIQPWGTEANDPVTCKNTCGLGKLVFLDEPAGKVRVVAMVDPITQSILDPLHQWIFSLLKKIPEDGTFDQRGPLELLVTKGVKEVFSYDLSAATDRLPLLLQKGLLAGVLGEQVSQLWANLLVKREYSISSQQAEKRQLNQSAVFYSTGQPMGAYSSWAMLALTHHFCIQLAACSVYGVTGNWFSMYAVLGDDVVIADKAVAKAYLSIMKDGLCVDINESKSLISSNGTMEFAKKTFVRGKDATPCSLKGFMAGVRNIPAFEGVMASMPQIWSNRLPSVCRALGYGYKSLARLPVALKSKSRLQGLLVFLTRPGGIIRNNDFLSWVTQDAWNCVGGRITDASLQAVWDSYRDWAGNVLLRELKRRKDAFSRDSKNRGWLPTSLFPTRTLFDVYQNLVLRPISKDIDLIIADLEVQIEQWKKEPEVDFDVLHKYIEEITEIENKVSNLPSSPKVAVARKSKVTTASSTLKLWRRLRRLVRKD